MTADQWVARASRVCFVGVAPQSLPPLFLEKNFVEDCFFARRRKRHAGRVRSPGMKKPALAWARAGYENTLTINWFLRRRINSIESPPNPANASVVGSGTGEISPSVNPGIKPAGSAKKRRWQSRSRRSIRITRRLCTANDRFTNPTIKCRIGPDTIVN